MLCLYFQLFTRNLVTQPIKEEQDVDLLEEDRLVLAQLGGPEQSRDAHIKERRGKATEHFLSMKWQWTYGQPTLSPWNNHFHTSEACLKPV